jgi:hypothetical protein
MEKSSEDLKHIRSMMERSTKFLSLSGMSGVAAGIFALLGAGAAWKVIRGEWWIGSYPPEVSLAIIMLGVMLLAGTAGLYFSMRKARRSGMKFWTPVTRQILMDFAIPMVTGGVLCMVLLRKEPVELVPALTLVFYGLALIAAGARTYKEIRILGFCEIGLGIVAALFPSWEYLLCFWALGFGVLHILYGVIMYCRYDKKA